MSPMLERLNPEVPCQEGEHHPHVLICSDPDDQCEGDYYLPYYAPYNELTCCLCGEEWPCRIKRNHETYRKAVAAWRGLSVGTPDRSSPGG